MADISVINVNGVDYDIKDSTARTYLGGEDGDMSMYDMVEAIYNKVGAGTTYSNDLVRYDVPLMYSTSTSSTADLSFIDGYQYLSIDDMDVGFYKCWYSNTASAVNITFSYEYDASTGILTATGTSSYQGSSSYDGINYLTIFIGANLSRYIPTSSSGTVLTFDMSSVSGYANKTEANFIPIFDFVREITSSDFHMWGQTYDASTGILTVAATPSSNTTFNTSTEMTSTTGIKIAII